MSLEKRFHKFTHVYCLSCGHHWDVPIYCGNRFCDVCSGKRRSRVRQRIDFIIKQLNKKKQVSLKLLTLTVRSQDNLKGMIKHLSASFRKMRNMQYWKRQVFGGVFVFEIKGNPHCWHVHIHAIIESYYLDWYRIRRMWEKCSGSPGIDIRRAWDKKAVDYVIKYITKPSVPDSLLDDVNKELQGSRLFQPFGEWYAINSKFVYKRPGCPKCNQNSLALWCQVFHEGTFWEYKEVLNPQSGDPPSDDSFCYANPAEIFPLPDEISMVSM